jgi:OOP family OmpA-OmpF porin
MKTSLNKKLILMALLLSTTSASIMAQDSTKVKMQTMETNTIMPFSPSSSYNTWSFGVNGGVLMPITVTNLTSDYSAYEYKIGYGAYIKKQLGHTFGLQADFLRGILKGSSGSNNNNNNTNTNRAYQTDINWSASLSANVSLGNISWLHHKSYIQPYANVGGGIIGYRNVTNNAANVDVSSGTKDIREFFIPVALGSKFTLGRFVNLDLGYKMAFVNTDALDGSITGTTNDKFSYGYLGLEFALGNRNKPQLATHNPILDMQKDYVAKYDDLKNQLEMEKTDMANEKAKMAEQQAKFLNDADGDGVSDYFDKCVNTPSGTKVDGSGCPLPSFTINKPADVKVYITEEDKKVVKDAIKNLEFDLGKSTIRPTSFESLNRVSELLINKNFSLKLAGHTDNTGTIAGNLKLSKDRAESIKTYLVSKGVNPSRIEATGYGESQPIKSNKTAEGRQMNRRVEFTLY